MDWKWIVTIFLVVISLYLIYWHLLPSSPEELLVEKSSFSRVTQDLMEVKRLCIIEYLNTTNDKIRRNIMQCGTDFASSAAALGIEVEPYVIEDGICYSNFGKMSEDDCIRFAKARLRPVVSSPLHNCVIFFIYAGETSESYRGVLAIGVNESYHPFECKLSISDGLKG